MGITDPQTPTASPPNSERLLAALASADDSLMESAARDLVTYGAAALPAVRGLLCGSEPDQRWWAVRILGEIPGPQVPGYLLVALHDPDPSVRQCAALALRQQPWPAAIPDLLALLGDKDRLLARLAGDALVAIGKPAVAELLETLQAGSQLARLEAVRALALIGDTRAISSLFTALDDESALIEHWADEGLERMGVGMAFFKPG